MNPKLLRNKPGALFCAISAASVLLVNKARSDSGWVVHTVEGENQREMASDLADVVRSHDNRPSFRPPPIMMKAPGRRRLSSRV